MKHLLAQYACCFIVTSIQLIISFAGVWPSYANPMLKSDQSPLGYKITPSEESLIGSIPMLGSLLATLFAGYLGEKLGRKRPQLLCGLMFAVSWTLILTARSTIQLLISRFMIGIAGGAALVVSIVHINEISQLSIRGSTSSMIAFMFNIGVIFSYLSGWFCSYNVICYINISVTVLYVVLISCLRETPSYLLKMGREKEALSSLKFYRAESETTEEILKEFAYLKSLTHNVDDDDDETDVEKPITEKTEKSLNEKTCMDEKKQEKENSLVLLWTVPHNRRMLINSVLFTIMTVSMGMVAIHTYSVEFFTKAVPSLSSNLCSVMLAVVHVVATMLTMAITDLFPRRTLMITNCSMVTICLAVLAAGMRWSAIPTWVTILAVILFCFAFHLGALNMVVVQMSESYGPQVRSAATAIIVCAMYCANFNVLFFFGPSVRKLGFDGTFFLFSLIGVITTILAVFLIRETRHVPQGEIENMYATGYLYKKVSAIES